MTPITEKLVTDSLGFRLEVKIEIGDFDFRGRHTTYETPDGQVPDDARHLIQILHGLQGAELAEVVSHEVYHLFDAVGYLITCDDETETSAFGHLVRRIYHLACAQASSVVIGVDKGSPDGDCTVRGHRDPDGRISVDSVEYSPAEAPEAIATGPKLPSRFQLHEDVRAQGARGTVSAVTFMLIDGMGKVAYDVDCGGQTLHRVLSDDIAPAKAAHLRPVPSPAAPDSKG